MKWTIITNASKSAKTYLGKRNPVQPMPDTRARTIYPLTQFILVAPRSQPLLTKHSRRAVQCPRSHWFGGFFNFSVLNYWIRMLINAAASVSYSAVLMRGSLTAQLTHSCCSRSRTLDTPNDRLARCQDTVYLKHLQTVYNSKITSLARRTQKHENVFFIPQPPKTWKNYFPSDLPYSLHPPLSCKVETSQSRRLT